MTGGLCMFESWRAHSLPRRVTLKERMEHVQRHSALVRAWTQSRRSVVRACGWGRSVRMAAGKTRKRHNEFPGTAQLPTTPDRLAGAGS